MTTKVSPSAILTRAELVALIEAALAKFYPREWGIGGPCHYEVEEFILDFVAQLENEAKAP